MEGPYLTDLTKLRETTKIAEQEHNRIFEKKMLHLFKEEILRIDRTIRLAAADRVWFVTAKPHEFVTQRVFDHYKSIGFKVISFSVTTSQINWSE